MTDRWVIVAPARRDTPHDTRPGVTVTADRSQCPFCPGHEDRTTATTAARTDALGRWTARAFANLYPMVTPNGDVARGVVRGAHEVIVETPDHDADLADLADAHARDVVDIYRDRLRALARVAGVRAVVLFKNRGPRAGGSLLHSHAQVLALPVVAPEQRRRDAIARRSHRATGRCAVAVARDRELAEGARLVEATERFVVLCPYGPQRSHETWIVPRDGGGLLVDLPDNDLGPLGAVLARTLRRLRAVTRGADYNVVLRAPALEHRGAPWALWHLELLPRLGGEAGFELATGMNCVVVAPEESAAALRDAGRQPGG